MTEFSDATRTVLAAVYYGGATEEAGEAGLSELESLVKTAGGTVVGILTQSRRAPEVRTLMGEGKVRSLRTLYAPWTPSSSSLIMSSPPPRFAT